MSMEQAILELAAGMKELAAAVRAGFGSDQMIQGVNQVKVALAPLTKTETLADTVEIAKDKIAKQKAERDADQQAAGVCPEAAESMAAQDSAHPEKDAELEAAVTKVEEDAKPLDYKADVRPVLLALNKAKGGDALKGLLTKYGAATGDKLAAEHYAAIVADAKALIG